MKGQLPAVGTPRFLRVASPWSEVHEVNRRRSAFPCFSGARTKIDQIVGLAQQQRMMADDDGCVAPRQLLFHGLDQSSAFVEAEAAVGLVKQQQAGESCNLRNRSGQAKSLQLASGKLLKRLPRVR